MSRYVAESITTDAGCFSHIGLCQLRTYSWQRPTWPKHPASVVIDSATYLLMISSPSMWVWHTPHCPVAMVIGAYLVGPSPTFSHAWNCCGRTCSQTQPGGSHLQLVSCTRQAAMGTKETVNPCNCCQVRRLHRHTQHIVCMPHPQGTMSYAVIWQATTGDEVVTSSITAKCLD